jgi:hypothetical protein
MAKNQLTSLMPERQEPDGQKSTNITYV